MRNSMPFISVRHKSCHRITPTVALPQGIRASAGLWHSVYRAPFPMILDRNRASDRSFTIWDLLKVNRGLRALMCVIACLLLTCSTLAQSPCETTQATFGNQGSLCGPALIVGQSFTATETGWLTEVVAARCKGQNTQLAIRLTSPSGSDWNSGAILGTSTVLLGDASSNCLPTESQLDAYTYASFDFTGVGVELGKQYVIEFIEGYGRAGCEGDVYDGGSAQLPYTGVPTIDLQFQGTICQADLTFGCLDDSKCNYNPLADANNGECATEDCAGTCGGSAYVLEGCQCVGGETGMTAADCYGCTDPEACNYDSTLIDGAWFYPMIDDGTCAEQDCNGTCDGTARLTESCGCIGGTTGIPDGRCIDGCVCETPGSNRTACNSAMLMKGQTFTVAQTSQIKEVTIAACCSAPVQFKIRIAPSNLECQTNLWNTGEVIYTSSTINNICQFGESCSNTSGYSKRYWQPDGLLLEAGTTYVLELSKGYSIGACSDGDLPGTGYSLYGTVASTLLFELAVCSDLQNWGCEDPEAANYSAQSQFANPYFCEYVDCFGELNGTGTFREDCGCIDSENPIHLIECPNSLDASLISNGSEPCNSRLYGQTWTAIENGYLTGFQCLSNPEADLSGVMLQGTDGAVDTLATFSYSGQTNSTCETQSDQWTTLFFDSIPLQENVQYRFEFTVGNAAATCINDYEQGVGLNIVHSPSNRDLAFHIAYQPDNTNSMLWGCVNPLSCNFLANATHDSGVCEEYDCNGECGGSAVYIDGCGCREGTTGVPTSSCTGCTDPSSCNYDPFEHEGLTYGPVTDDGTCKFADCSGECGGFAYATPNCGCIGGSTGIDPASCLAICQSATSISTFNLASNYGGIKQSGFVQGFTIDPNLHVTGLRMLQLFAPTTPLTARIWKGPDPYPSSASIIDTLYEPTLTSKSHFGLPLLQALFLVPVPYSSAEDTYFFIELLDGPWSSPTNPFDSYPDGAAYASSNASFAQNDLAFEVITCSEIYGCTDPQACNFEPWATEMLEGSCFAFCTDSEALNFTPVDDADPNCVALQYCEYELGCINPAACNYNANSTYAVHPHDNSQFVSCIMPDPNLCEICSGETDGTGSIADGDTDNDNICDADEIVGCNQPAACNYNANATDPGTCIYPNACIICSDESTDGTGSILTQPDADGDGLCDIFDICSDPLAINWDDIPSTECIFQCEVMPDPLVFGSLGLHQAASSEFNEDGYLSISYSGGHGDSLVWTALVVDLTTMEDTTELTLGQIVGPLKAALYSVEIKDGYGCSGTIPPVILDQNGLPIPEQNSDNQRQNYQVIQPADSTRARLAIPYTICE